MLSMDPRMEFMGEVEVIPFHFERYEYYLISSAVILEGSSILELFASSSSLGTPSRAFPRTTDSSL